MLRFFDFDYTLIAHDWSVKKYMGNAEFLSQCIAELTQQQDIYKNSKPLEYMQWYVKKCHEQGDKLYCITSEIFNLRDKYKQDFINKYYIPMVYLTVDTPEHKIDMIRAIAEVENVRLSFCNLIEDRMDTVYLACDAGIRGTHISEIMLEYEEYRKAAQ